MRGDGAVESGGEDSLVLGEQVVREGVEVADPADHRGPGHYLVNVCRELREKSYVLGVTLDEHANDGVAGEGDDVRTIDVVGSPGPDAISGDARGNKLTGSGGADVLNGADGDDTIDATLPYGTETDGPDGTDTVTLKEGEAITLYNATAKRSYKIKLVDVRAA